MTRIARACGGLVSALLACSSPYIRSEPVSDRWIQVTHPTLPVTFQIPDNGVREPNGSVGVMGLGRVRGPDGDVDRVDEFGLRLVYEEIGRIYAVGVEIRRLTARNPDVTPASIQQLARAIDDPDASIAFFTTVFLELVRNESVVFTRLGPSRSRGFLPSASWRASMIQTPCSAPATTSRSCRGHRAKCG